MAWKIKKAREQAEELAKAAERLRVALQEQNQPRRNKPEIRGLYEAAEEWLVEVWESLSELENVDPILEEPEGQEPAVAMRRVASRELADVREPEGTDALDFASFFTSISGAFLDAQKELDQKSLEYVEQTVDKPHVEPGVFRIPSVSAEFKFALKEIKDKKANMVFYSKSSEETRLNQQTVRFDLKASPPPQEMLKKLRSATPRAQFVLSPPARETLLAAIPQDAGTPPTFKSAPQRVLILVDGERRFLLLFANKTTLKVGVWSLEVAEKVDTGSGTVLEIVPFATAALPAAALRQLHAILLRQANEQEKFLDAIR